ncbi:MAG: peroxidase [Planctomycetota bacterium]
MTAVKEDWRSAELSPADRALAAFAEKLTREPAAMSPKDLEILREHGMDDEAISSATQVIAYFNYINRIADALGVDLEEWMPPHPHGDRRHRNDLP